MSFRICGRLKTFLYSWAGKLRDFSSVNRLLLAQKPLKPISFFNRYQHSSGKADFHSRDNGRQENDLLAKLPEKDNEKNIKRDVGPIQRLYPSKQFTKSARIFETIAANSLNEDGFKDAIEEFKRRDLKRLKLIDFVSTALDYMDTFGVSKNLDAYNRLLAVFPKGCYHYRTVFDTVWTRYRLQIDCALQVLTKMEENGLRPNVDTYDIVHAVFGDDSMPLNKVRRIVFWFDKFNLMYPHPLPQQLPSDRLELFELAIKRMMADQGTISVYQDSEEKGHSLIVGTQSADLLKQLQDLDEKKSVFVEGPHVVWLRRVRLYYYTLQANVTPCLAPDDRILALCMIENGDEREVKRWINELQKDFPKLAELNVIFNLSNNEEM